MTEIQGPFEAPCIYQLLWHKFFGRTKERSQDRYFISRINGSLICLLAAAITHALYLHWQKLSASDTSRKWDWYQARRKYLTDHWVLSSLLDSRRLPRD